MSSPNWPSYCLWCDRPATTTVQIAPDEYRSVKGVKTKVASEVRVPSCTACATAPRELAPTKDEQRARRAAKTKKWRGAQGTLI